MTNFRAYYSSIIAYLKVVFGQVRENFIIIIFIIIIFSV
jgi:hypothetical protein